MYNKLRRKIWDFFCSSVINFVDKKFDGKQTELVYIDFEISKN